MKQIKYLLLVPVLACMLFYTACSNTKNEIIEKEVIPFAIIDKVLHFLAAQKMIKAALIIKYNNIFKKSLM